MIKYSLVLFFFVTTGLLSGQIIFAQIKDVQNPDHNFFLSAQAPESNEQTRAPLYEKSQRHLATATVIFENGETEFYENVENEFIESLENVLSVLPNLPEESTTPVEAAVNNESNINEGELTENAVSELGNNEGLTEEAVLVNEHEIQVPGSEELGEVSQGGEIIFGEEGNISSEEVSSISSPGELEVSAESSENEILSGGTEITINEEQSPEIVISGENSENLPEEIIFSETEVPSNESGGFIQEEVGLPSNEEFGESLETGSEEGENGNLAEGSNEEVTELERIIIIGEGENVEFIEGHGEIAELEGVNELAEEIGELEGIVIIGEGENTELTEGHGEITELEGIIIVGGEGEIPEFNEENAEITELEGIVIIGENEGEIPEFTEEIGELTELEGIVIIGEGGEVPEFTEENAEITELEGIAIIGEGENTEFTEEHGEITELEGIIIIGEGGEVPEFTEENTEITELEGIVIIGEGGEGEIPEFTEENEGVTGLEGVPASTEEITESSEFNESELIVIELPEENVEVIIIGSGSGEETILETGEVIIEEVGEETIVIIETGEGESIISEAEVIFGEGGETIIIIIPTPEESPTKIIVITGSGEFEVPNEQTTPPIPVETVIEGSETVIWSEATTVISETTIIETTITEYVIIILETGFGSGSESIEEVPIIIVEEGEGGGSEPVEEQTYETVIINYEAPADLNFSVGTQVVSIQGGGGGNIDIGLGHSGSEESLEEESNNTTSGSGSATYPGWPGWTGGPGWSSEPASGQLGESGELTNWDIQVNTQARSVIQLAPGAQDLQTASIYSGDFTEVISQVAIEIDDQLFFIDSLYLIRPNLKDIGLAPIIVEAAPKRCQQIESCEMITIPGVGPQSRCQNHLICE